MSQTFTVPTATRGGSSTPIILGPVAVPAGTTEIQVSSVMTSADILSTSPAYTIDFAVQVQYGAGQPFQDAASTHWVSGPDNTNPRGTHGPGLNVEVDPSAAQVQAKL